MTTTTETRELTRAICFAVQGLQFAFGDFVSGKSKSVSTMDDLRETRESMALLEYLRTLARILLPLTGIVPDLQDTCLRWVEHKVTRVEGEAAKKTLTRVLKAVDRMEQQLTAHLSKPPPFEPRIVAITADRESN